MARYNGKNYSLPYALENIGEYFWRIYQDDLFEYAKDQSRKDIFESIHQTWDAQMNMSSKGTDIRIEWAVAIYNHGDWEKSIKIAVPNYKDTSTEDYMIDPRRKYSAEYRCDNGVYVRSISELCIANWLYANNIPFEYERTVMFGEVSAHCDFYLPMHDVYVEYWGMVNDEKYFAYKQWKEPLYIKYGYKLVPLYPNDLKNFRDRFLLKLNKYFDRSQ